MTDLNQEQISKFVIKVRQETKARGVILIFLSDKDGAQAALSCRSDFGVEEACNAIRNVSVAIASGMGEFTEPDSQDG